MHAIPYADYNRIYLAAVMTRSLLIVLAFALIALTLAQQRVSQRLVFDSRDYRAANPGAIALPPPGVMIISLVLSDTPHLVGASDLSHDAESVATRFTASFAAP